MKSLQNSVSSLQDISITEEQEKFPFLFIPNYIEHLSDCWNKALHLGTKYIYHKNEDFILHNAFAYIKSRPPISYFREFVDLRDEIRSFIGSGCLIKYTYSGAEYGYFPTSHKCVCETEIYQFDSNIIYDTNFINNSIVDFKENNIECNIDFYILIKDLDYLERYILILYYEMGYSSKDISKILNINENTLKTKISRSKMKIKKIIEKY